MKKSKTKTAASPEEQAQFKRNAAAMRLFKKLYNAPDAPPSGSRPQSN
jgi:hypothetical protein